MPQSKRGTKKALRDWKKKQEKPESGRELLQQPKRDLDDDPHSRASSDLSKWSCICSNRSSELTYEITSTGSTKQSGESPSVETAMETEGTESGSPLSKSKGRQKKWQPFQGDVAESQSRRQRLAQMGIEEPNWKGKGKRNVHYRQAEGGTRTQTESGQSTQVLTATGTEGAETASITSQASDHPPEGFDDGSDGEISGGEEQQDDQSCDSCDEDDTDDGASVLEDIDASSGLRTLGGFKPGRDAW